MSVKKIIPYSILFAFTAPLWAASCPLDQLKAEYRISTETDLPSSPKTAAQSFTLWRKGRQIAHQYKDAGVVELWYLQQNQTVQLTRYFEQYQQGIEYQPSEIVKANTLDWQAIYSMVDEALITSAQQKQSTPMAEQLACDTVVNYSGEFNQTQYTLAWMPALKLIKQMTITAGDASKTWTLQATSFDSMAIDKQYQRWDQYLTTDYADVGDNESNPFLAKMIHLGFKTAGSEVTPKAHHH